MKGDSGSALFWGNANANDYDNDGVVFPKDVLYQNRMLEPDMTGSVYQRYIFEASQSYWIPTHFAGGNPDLSDVTDFSVGSTEVQILSGSTKTSPYKITDNSGKYQNYTTVVTASGVPFFGSVMPAGELFRIFTMNTLTSSLSGSWNLDSQTSGAAVTNAMLTDFSGRENTGSIEGTPLVSTGLEVHNRNYGNSFLFQSESNEGVRFFSDNDFNYNRDDNFSLSVWAKRFHPNTGSADPGAGNGAQPIFTRGAQETSYGIDYDFVNGRIRAGVRPDSGIINAFYDPPDDLLDWHHLVFTFESGSTTGIKLYVDGDLKSTRATTGTTYRVTGSNAFSSSVDSINSETDVLSIGGNNVLGGSSRYYNGFIQYPRVYNRTITPSEVSQLYLTPDSITDTKITDVKITLKNPVDVLPFDNLFHTSSVNWTDWYNTLFEKAKNFDTDNIHSLQNNLPLFIQNDLAYDEFREFLSLQGEQYDVIRNHIDSLGTLHDRGYKKTDSPPENTYPMLLDSMGYQAINPFSGSLSDSLGSYLSGVTSIDDIKNNTWRKTLNNLIYIYKSKGTKNSVRGLLNVYGYPPDVIKIQEFGGSNQENQNPLFSNNPPTTGPDSDVDLLNNTGSFDFTLKQQKLYRYIFNGKSERNFGLSWWIDNSEPNTIELIYKHNNTTNTQTILESSGSGALRAVSSMQVNSSTTSDFDGKILIISSSDGTGKTYIFDDDADGATGTLDGAGRVRIQISGLINNDEIATEISTSISHVNGLFGKISVSDSVHFLTNTQQNFITSDDLLFFANASGSVILTQLTASVAGNTTIGGNIPSTTILTSSFTGGSDIQKLWDLRLIPDNEGVSSSFEFRLNNTSQASSSIDSASKSISMSTNYTTKHDGQLWNVMLQRMTSSVSGSGTNEYRLHTALQDKASITTYNYVTMSVSGGLTTDSNYYANQNWVSTGSRNELSSSNLIVGVTLSSSLSQVKAWSTSLSASKFRQHTLNKFSTTGNSIDSHRKELIYHYKLNENYTTSSVSSSTQKLNIIDASPSTTYKDYSFKISGSIVSASSVLYGFDSIDVFQIGNTDNIEYKSNDNKITISPSYAAVGNLSADKPAIIFDKSRNKPLFNTSVRLELMESPQDRINQYILNNMDAFNFEKFYGNPKYEYSSSYTEFDTLRNNFFDSHPITLNVNKFITSYENISNNSIVKGIQSLVPARSTMSDKNAKFGVMIKPTILEKQKYEREENSVEINPNVFSGSISFVENTEYKITSLTSTYEEPKSGSISMGNSYTTSSEYSTPPFLELNGITSSIELEKSGSIDVLYYNSNNDGRISSNIEIAKSGSISLGNIYVTGSHTTPLFLQKNGITSSIVLPKSGSIDYALIANKSFVNIHDSWGAGHTTGSDTHFINYAGGTGSRGNYNVAHIDTRNKFRLIGDLEVYSGSVNIPNDFTNHHNLHNREILSDDFHGDITYESYINGNPGNQTGRAIGKTRYFSASADGGTLYFPANHVSKFSQPFKEQMYKGTQNVNPGKLNVQHEDYSTASFYRVTVTGGENQIIVNTGDSSIGNDDKIIRG